MSDIQIDGAEKHKNEQGSLQAALARTISRSIALYFSRPVRFFRPSKVSGWQSLGNLATQQGTSLSPSYFVSLIKLQGFSVIPKHFVPPMIVNATLGTVLWASYAQAYDTLELRLGQHPLLAAAISGGIAGGMQALVAAPAENVRLVIEGGTAGHSWSHAWKEVFRGSTGEALPDQKLQDIRQLRGWMKEVGEMAGRGWNGWGWGCAKDICAFSVFFTIFELSRRSALVLKGSVQDMVDTKPTKIDPGQLSRVVHSSALVTGGVVAGLAYDVMCRPWDKVRRIIHLNKILSPSDSLLSSIKVIVHTAREEGLLSFVKNPSVHTSTPDGTTKSKLRIKFYSCMRTLGRVGPWGVGFLVWEAYGSNRLHNTTNSET